MQELIKSLKVTDQEIEIITNEHKAYWIEKEKQMVIDAYDKGIVDGDCYGVHWDSTGKQYYNETFKQ